MSQSSQERGAAETTGCDHKSIMEPGIVAYPPGPGLLRVCPNCGAWFALRYVDSVDHELVGKIHRYRCKRCGKELDYADTLPDDSLG